MSDSLYWKELSREKVFDVGFRSMDKVVFELPNGKLGTYHLRCDGDCVVTVALTKEQDVILSRQYRPGKKRVILDIPGGGIKPNQTPEEAAKAELLEETGYTGTFRYVGECWPDGYSSRILHVFVATDCERVQDQTLDEYEFIEVVRMPLKEFRAFIRTGQMTDIDGAYLGLDYLGLL